MFTPRVHELPGGPWLLVAVGLLTIAVAAAASHRRAARATRARLAPDAPPRNGGQVALFGGLGAIALFLGGLGAWASYSTVERRARMKIDEGGWGWGDKAWMVPVAIDVAILFFDGWEMIASQMRTPDGRRRSARWMRVPPRVLIGVTIFLNVQDSGGTAAAVSHAAVVSVYVLVVAYARHTIQPPVSADHKDGAIPWVRWLLRPYPTWCIWQMTKLEGVGWREARDVVACRLIVRSALKSEFAGGWEWCPIVSWRKVPLEKRALVAAGRLQGLSEEADRVLGWAAAPGGVSGGEVAGGRSAAAAALAGARPQPLSPAVPGAALRVPSSGGPEGEGAAGVAAGGGRWVAAGLRVISQRGLPGDVAVKVLAVAEALDGFAAGPFGEAATPTQGEVERSSGVTRPTVKKWWEAMSKELVDDAEGGDEGEGEGRGPVLVAVEG